MVEYNLHCRLLNTVSTAGYWIQSHLQSNAVSLPIEYHLHRHLSNTVTNTFYLSPYRIPSIQQLNAVSITTNWILSLLPPFKYNHYYCLSSYWILSLWQLTEYQPYYQISNSTYPHHLNTVSVSINTNWRGSLYHHQTNTIAITINQIPSISTCPTTTYQIPSLSPLIEYCLYQLWSNDISLDMDRILPLSLPSNIVFHSNLIPYLSPHIEYRLFR